MEQFFGKKNWLFCDGDLPPAGDREPLGHEALMVTNLNAQDVHLVIDLYFEDREPVKGLTAMVAAERVHCFRLDQPLGDQRFQIPSGQYSLVLHSDLPVASVFGRLDVRQPNLAYYSVTGYAW
ncbi:MAG: hypothetical protein GX821_04260 [Clostridiaceae bacterium]|nr:sensory rhodopsin transducer [Eubacteriales bacterium]MDD4018648.1 sensory rhodopsin transducer [Kiritimatiellia bacterium]MDD4743949.1 sensory rhodopsin transducer [Eubacteriales bacterium]NLB44363.1 hypothetical protein [Clostridiaceae bacterium]